MTDPPGRSMAPALVLNAVMIFAAVFLATPPAALALDRPSVAVARIGGALKIDGTLDEPAWASAPVIAGFRLMTPREDQAPDESTAVRVLVDDQRIVFGIWCSARRPLRASLTPRDQITDGDHITIHIDTDGDGQRAYIFGVNPFGVELDGILTDDPDFKWDAVWDAAARREAGAWTAEIAVPFRAMRFPAHATRPWRLWMRREITAWNEVGTWPLYRAGEAGRVMLQAGDLTGLEGVHGGGALTIEPYVFGSVSGVRDVLPGGDLSEWSSDHQHEEGVDVQSGVTSSLALNATYNPDFSQIEADALQINLNRRFPLQFPEKRPFFLEGGENFKTPLDLIYTRRMADPHWGGKLTGRAGAINSGALFVRDHGGASLAGSGYGPEDISRPGYFAIGRAQLPFGEGSNVGVLAGAHTQDAEDVSGDPRLHDDGALNHIESLDTQIRLSSRWSMESQLAMTATRISSVVAFDTTTGTGVTNVQEFRDGIGLLRLNYRDKARSVRFGTRYVGPRYRNELGFQERVGVIYRRANFDWNLFPQKGAFQRVDPVLDLLVLHDHTGRPEFADVNPHVELQFRSNLFWDLGFHEYVEHWQSTNYTQERAHVYFEDTRWRAFSWNLEAQVGDGIYYGDTDSTSYLAWTEMYNGVVTVRPSASVSLPFTIAHLRVAHRPTSGEVVNQWLLGVNANVQFTRQLAARVYPQYDSFTRHLDVNVLLSYVVHPGTVVYLGVNSGLDEIGARPQPTTRVFFAKASYRFAL